MIRIPSKYHVVKLMQHRYCCHENYCCWIYLHSLYALILTFNKPHTGVSIEVCVPLQTLSLQFLICASSFRSPGGTEEPGWREHFSWLPWPYCLSVRAWLWPLLGSSTKESFSGWALARDWMDPRRGRERAPPLLPHLKTSTGVSVWPRGASLQPPRSWRTWTLGWTRAKTFSSSLAAGSSTGPPSQTTGRECLPSLS